MVICVSGYVDSNILNFYKNFNTNSFTYQTFLKKISSLQVLYDHLVVIELDNFLGKKVMTIYLMKEIGILHIVGSLVKVLKN